MTYQADAIEAGYTDYSAAVQEEIGMAIERAYTDWDYYAEGLTETRQYKDVAACFEYSTEAPTEKALVEAYAEGVVC